MNIYLNIKGRIKNSAHVANTHSVRLQFISQNTCGCMRMGSHFHSNKMKFEAVVFGVKTIN